MPDSDLQTTGPGEQSVGSGRLSKRARLIIAAVAATIMVVAIGAFAYAQLAADEDGFSSRLAAGASGESGEEPADSQGDLGESEDKSAAQSPSAAAPGDSESPESGASGVKPAEQGSKLTTVTTAPTRTISSVKVPSGSKTSRYQAAIEPYGWAPAGPDGRRMAVLIRKWEPTDGGPSDVRDLSGENALVSLSSYKGTPIATGGRYDVIIEVRATDDGRGTLYLVSVEPTR